MLGLIKPGALQESLGLTIPSTRPGQGGFTWPR